MANGVTIHLIRHEKTLANVERRYIGSTDQSIIIANPRQITLFPVVVYGSALKRCKETAQLYFPHCRYVANSGFNELDFGDFEMKTYAELQYFLHYRDWIDDPLRVTPPNGENFAVFQKRVLQTLEQIVQSQDEYTFVVHGGVIRVILAAFLPNAPGFSQVQAQHHTQYTLQWDTLDAFKEGSRCISYSEAYLTEKENM